MFKISDAITNINSNAALVPFLTAGYPSIEITSKVINILDTAGVNAIEIGIPYSDALADGIVIQESSRIALNQQIYVDEVFSLIRSMKKNIKAPVIIFTYLNPVLAKGIDSFVRELAYSGAQGLAIPDLPLEESDYILAVCKYYDIELILFISPASTQERTQEILLKAPGCIYLVSSYGVTGLRNQMESNILDLIETIKNNSNKPIMLGFGISNEKQVRNIMNLNLDVDAIVMGSAFINQIADSYKINDYSIIYTFCKKIKKAMALDL